MNISNFGKVDDLINYLKAEAAKKSISPEEMDKLALKVAVMDNILTQAAVDIMAKYSDGDLQKILSNLDIYKANLKTWTDLQEYIMKITNGRITPEELNKIAAAILTNVNPSIDILRKKIVAFSETAEDGVIMRQSVNTVDLSNFKVIEKWLLAFYNESLNQGLTRNRMAELFSAIGSLPDTKASQYLFDLTEYSEEPLTSALKSIDLNKEKIMTPKDLILFLLSDKDKFPEEALMKSIANLVVKNDISADSIKSRGTTGKSKNLWIIWILLASGIFIFYFVFWKNRKEDKK